MRWGTSAEMKRPSQGYVPLALATVWGKKCLSEEFCGRVWEFRGLPSGGGDR